ncbi:MAG TPA: MarR family transcriptional regulator [Methanobacteriaceae archaeon]|nr:MarR family transcriptional regulator [Methanobacteriaceae archaeon]
MKVNNDDLRFIMNLFDEIDNKLLKSIKINMNNYEKLTLAEANALYVIGTQEPKTMKQIAEALGVAVSTPTRTIDRLVEKGLVNRTVGTKDRRQLLIESTPAGRRILAEMDEEGLMIIRKMVENLENKEIEDLKNILIKINENL